MKTTVIIDRGKWSRGKQACNALLIGKKIREDNREYANRQSRPLPKVGNMCCLGFACLAKGVSRRKLANVTMPDMLGVQVNGLSIRRGEKYWGYFDNTDFSRDAASINDKEDITESEREQELKALASEHGFIFKFVN